MHFSVDIAGVNSFRADHIRGVDQLLMRNLDCYPLGGKSVSVNTMTRSGCVLDDGHLHPYKPHCPKEPTKRSIHRPDILLVQSFCSMEDIHLEELCSLCSCIIIFTVG
jgi:hypothetical protein